MRRDPPSRVRSGGFTLAAVMVILAAILLLSVGVLAVVGIERKTARSYVDAKRAEWIARAGVEEVRTLLRDETLEDDFLILSRPAEQDAETETEPLDYLYLARGEGGGDRVRYRLTPLFSTASEPGESTDLQDLPNPATLVGEDAESFEIFPWADVARTAWIPVENDASQVVGRYAFWVEDLQARVGLGGAEDHDVADFEREPWPHPAPGVAPDPEGPPVELALHAFDPEAGDDPDATDLDDKLVEGRPLMISPDSALAAAGFEAPLERGDDGRLLDGSADAVERGVAPRVRPYEERPLVPHARGIDAALAGEPKLNLNELLEKPRDEAIADFKQQIEAGLPHFEDRKGGFPDDYLGTLAAGAFDYADEDGDATIAPSIRGLDAHPLISEHLVRFRWDRVYSEDGRKYMVLVGSVYAELWNMSNQQISGDFEISYETNYQFILGLVPDPINLGSPELLDDPKVTNPTLQKVDGYYWFPSQRIDLEPNQYRLLHCGTVTYTIDAGPSSVWIPSPLTLEGEDEAQVGYRMKWNGVLVDQPRGNVKHPDIIVNYPLDTMTQARQGVWSTVPGHSYSIGRFDYVNNMGDPRMAYYIGLGQDPNDYPDNYSPNRRTIRWGNIYDEDSSTKPRVYGRVMPSEWPDGGHNTAFGVVPPAVRAGRDPRRGDERINPDDPQFFRNLPAVEPEKAPMRISNRGYFLSETELGRIYDPVMWVPTYESASDTSQIRSGRMPSRQSMWPQVEESSTPSSHYGGGNTLRIGRPEHPKFDLPGLHAAHLLDLFHVGISRSENEDDRRGALVRIDRRVNLNTATRPALVALMAGSLSQDPQLALRWSNSHPRNDQMAPPTRPLELNVPAESETADVIVDAIIRSRPFSCAADLAQATDPSGNPVFGNRAMYREDDSIQWTDSAAEEVFARVYNASTLRSRNFRVWVVGQALAPMDAGSAAAPEVLAEARKVFSVFADPGTRLDDDTIDDVTYRPVILYENDH